MPWYNQWSDSLKKRACRYLLQRYLGQFLEEKLTLDQLTVDLYNGTGSVSGVVLDVHALNELGDQENLPIEFVDGYISEMSVSIPLSQLFTESSYIEVTGLLLTVQPKKRACDGGAMFESMWNSMSNSMQLAAECLQQTVDEKETEGANLMEGLELFASAIDSVLTRVKIKFVNTILRLEHVPIKGVNGIAVEIRISNIDYCDEACSDPIYAESSPQTTYQSSTFSIKKFHCESINLYTDEFPAASRTFSRSVILKQDFDQANCHVKSGSDAILFGKLSGRQEIRLKLKQDDTVLGPKVDIELSLGSLTLFLSPRQMHLIVELVRSLGSPHTQDTSNVEPKNFSQKPMNICDYKKVEQELQDNISSLPLENKLKEKHQTNPGWSSASIDEIDEEFFPMKGNAGVSDSIISETAMDSSVGSTFTSATINSKCSCVSLENSTSWSGRRRGSKKGLSSVGDSDFSGEMTGFNIRLASLSVVLLHADVLIFDTDSFSLTPMSISVMKNLSSNFFQSLGVYEIQGYGNKDFKQVKDLLSSACTRCHIRLIATTIMVEGSEKGNDWSRSVGVVLTTASFQATECIYSEKTNDGENSPHFVELLNFMRANEDSVKPHFPISSLPDVRLHFEQLKKFRNSNPNAFIKLDISFSVTMQQCWTEVDLSIIDRISAIIHLENLCQSTNLTKETRHELSSFSKAVETSLADVKFDFKLSTPFLVIKFRFPIPDLRPVHDLERSPWWKRNVRKDILYFNLIEPSVRSESNNRTYLQSYKMYCSEIVALFQEGSINVPVAFARATHNKYGSKPTKIGQCIGLPCISFRINPKEIITELEETEDGPSCSQSCFMETSPKQPSPFRVKHVVHGNSESGGSESNQLAETYGEELIVPADKQEMNEFVNLATRTARIQVDVSLPFVAVHFPSKHFYEVLYNRFNSDLSLWQTSAQKLHSCDTGNNCHLDDYSRHPLFPAFSLCKSGLLYDSDSDSDDGPRISQMNNAKSKQKKAIKQNGQSKYSLNIAVSQGLFNVVTTLKDTSGKSVPELRGELQINVEEGSVFIVNNFKGVPQQNYVCLLVNEAALYFKDVHKQPSLNSSPLFTPNINPSHLSPTIYFQHTAASNKPASSENCKNMLRAAIHTEVNENKVKIIRVSCGLENATLQHKVCLPQYTWLTQLMEFFDVIDYPVRGYDSPQVVTELHQHLWDCTIDYRPLNLPLKSVVTIGSLSLSSNIAARTKSSTFRFITEEANLFISNNMNNTSNIIDLKKDYVSVIELGLFELSLRLSDSVKCPKVDLKALINIVNIRTCSDSARALAQLIKYFASDGDLNNPDTNEVTPSASLPNTNQDAEGTLSESTVERVNDMMEDAMLDDQNDTNKSEQLSDIAEEAKDVDVFIFPDEGTLNDTSVPVDWCGSDLESEHDFCLLEHEAGSGIMPKSGMPEVRILASPIVVIDNFFSLAVGKADLLLPPKHYPSPVFRYTLQDMTLIWHMYGGFDFGSNKKTESYVITTPQGESSSPSGRKKCYVDTVVDETYAERHSHITYEKSRTWSDNIKIHHNQESRTTSNKSTKWYTKGGSQRNTNILMQLQLNKVKFQHEVYPERGVQASRQVLLVQELEVRDRLSTSSINKFLYQYTSEASPRQSHANMVVVKAVHVRPDPRRNVQETCLKLSLLPLRLNIDQDSLVFLITFFSQLSGTNNEGGGDAYPTGGNAHQVPVMGVEKTDENMGLESNKRKDSKDKQPSLLIMFDEDVNCSLKPTPQPPPCNEPASTSPLYIRSFVFSPDVPIRIDYEGKRVDMTHGSLAGLLMGLGQLSCLQLKLKKLSYRHGILGFDKLVSYVVSEWVQDIKKNQLPNLIGGVGPMHSLVQLFQGIRDLFWLPIEQYQKDGRIVRGLQRGANSFTTSTAIAALEITARIVQAIQSVAETAFDMLSPGPSARRLHGKKGKRQHRYSRPADIREGLANAYSLVKEGLGETAETLVRVASVEAEQKGAVGAVGGVLRQIPPTVVAPIILASAATSNLLGGVKSQLAPDARREESNKWRTDENY